MSARNAPPPAGGEPPLHLTPAMIAWLAGGERGSSSNTLFACLTGIEATGGGGLRHPCDPDDLARCRKLLEACPELRAGLPRMAGVSPAWDGLVAEWDALCALMDEEAPDWRHGRGRAPRTWARMKALGC